MADKNQKNTKELTVEEKLIALYRLQKVDSKIDELHRLRGELPFVIGDLEDEIAGLETRIKNQKEEISVLKKSSTAEKNKISDSKGNIKEYESKLNDIRNNREFDSLNKEIEYQGLEIELSEKKIKNHTKEVEAKKASIADSQKLLEERQEDLDVRKSELDQIVDETQSEESKLFTLSEELGKQIDDRLVIAYQRIRKNVRNGLGVVKIFNEACGGCFNKIPPQRQLEIAQRKKVIVCEHCGRILVDAKMDDEVDV